MVNDADPRVVPCQWTNRILKVIFFPLLANAIVLWVVNTTLIEDNWKCITCRADGVPSLAQQFLFYSVWSFWLTSFVFYPWAIPCRWGNQISQAVFQSFKFYFRGLLFLCFCPVPSLLPCKYSRVLLCAVVDLWFNLIWLDLFALISFTMMSRCKIQCFRIRRWFGGRCLLSDNVNQELGDKDPDNPDGLRNDELWNHFPTPLARYLKSHGRKLPSENWTTYIHNIIYLNPCRSTFDANKVWVTAWSTSKPIIILESLLWSQKHQFLPTPCRVALTIPFCH